jgi:hypothetical protein
MTKQKKESNWHTKKIDKNVSATFYAKPSTTSQFCKWEEEVLNKIEDRDILLEFVPKEKQADFLHNFADVLFSFEQQAISKTQQEFMKAESNRVCWEGVYNEARAQAVQDFISDEELAFFVGTQGYKGNGKFGSPDEKGIPFEAGKTFTLKMCDEYDRRMKLKK